MILQGCCQSRPPDTGGGSEPHTSFSKPVAKGLIRQFYCIKKYAEARGPRQQMASPGLSTWGRRGAGARIASHRTAASQPRSDGLWQTGSPPPARRTLRCGLCVHARMTSPQLRLQHTGTEGRFLELTGGRESGPARPVTETAVSPAGPVPPGLCGGTGRRAPPVPPVPPAERFGPLGGVGPTLLRSRVGQPPNRRAQNNSTLKPPCFPFSPLGCVWGAGLAGTTRTLTSRHRETLFP